MGTDALVGVAIGLALSTAAGLRVFIPLLLTSLAGRAELVTLTPGMSWIGSDMALVAFATAAVLEVGAYYVAWLDNLLDAIATPVAVTAGVIASAAVMSDLPPLVRWTLAIVAGGGAAGLVQIGTALVRAKSSALTLGGGNAALATGELAGSVALSLLGLLAPFVAAAVAAGVLLLLARRALRLVRRRRRPA